MQPEKGDKITRRDLLKKSLLLTGGLLTGKLILPNKVLAYERLFTHYGSPDRQEESLARRPNFIRSKMQGIGEKVGLNLTNDPTPYDPEQIALSGAKWVRFVGEEKFNNIDYIKECKKYGLSTLMVMTSDSKVGPDWDSTAKFYYQNYGDLVDAFQIGNEPDDKNPNGFAAMLQGPKEFSKLLLTFRINMPNKFLVAGGMNNNPPKFLQDVDLQWVDAVGAHPYGQGLPDWPSPFYWARGHIGLVIDNYKRYMPIPKPIWITEFGMSEQAIGKENAPLFIYKELVYLIKRGDIDKAFFFCFSDNINPGFGLVDSEGKPKDSYHYFRSALADAAV